MLQLVTDPKQLQRVLKKDCPMRCRGIRRKIGALYQAYGFSYSFCSFYLSADEEICAALYQSVLYFSDAGDTSAEWGELLSPLPMASVFSDTALSLDGFRCTSGLQLHRQAAENDQVLAGVKKNQVSDACAVLKQAFPDIFAGQDASEASMRFYCDLSHRVRHGVSSIFVLPKKAAAVLDCFGEASEPVLLAQLGVVPSLQRTGFGKALLETALAAYAPREVLVFSQNTASDRFYRAVGFEPIGSWWDYERIREETDTIERT
jgi:GNAT superfamily N-acetyltransferase